jgi:hypothetical protein
MLQKKYDELINLTKELQIEISQRDALLNELHTKMAETQGNVMGTSDSQTTNHNPELIRARNEQMLTYLKIVGYVTGACLAVYFGYSLYAKWYSLSPWDWAHSHFKGVAQKFGYMPDIDKYSHKFGETIWQFHVTNKEHVATLVKYPGSGDFVDAYQLFNNLLPPTVREIQTQTTISGMTPLDPDTTIAVLDTVARTPEVIDTVNTVTTVINNIPLF